MAVARPRVNPDHVRVIDGDLRPLNTKFTAWLQSKNRSPHTIRIYTISVRQLADYLALVGMPTFVEGITGEHIIEFLRHLEESGAAEASRQTRWRGLKAFFDYLVKVGEIPESPMKTLERPIVGEPETPIPTLDEIDRLLAACKGKAFEDRRDLAILTLAVETGARRSEIAYLTLDDLNLKDHRIHIRGKGRLLRSASFTAESEEALSRYLKERREHPYAESRALWLGRQGPMQDAAIDLMARRRAKKAGLVGFHLHLLRHHYAYAQLHDGMSEGDVMDQAGWKRREMMDRYVKLQRHDLSAASYQRIGSPLSRRRNQDIAPGDRL